MNRYRYLIPTFIGPILLILYIPCYLLNGLLIRWGEEFFHPDYFIFIFCAFAAIHGAMRVCCFHPAFSKAYFNWLVLTPWDSSKPLPRGPVHLVWVDLVVLGLVSLLAYPALSYKVWIIPSVFLGAYLLFLNIALVMQGQGDGMLISVFVAPFLWWPYGPWSIFPVLLMLYGIAYWALCKQIKEFPWNTGWWKDNPVQQWKLQAGSLQQVGWPFYPMLIPDSTGISLSQSVVVAGLITWWVHSVSFIVGFPFIKFITTMFLLFLGMLRLVLYETGMTYRAPISFWGRMFTIYWFIRGYDRVFLASFLAAINTILFLLLPIWIQWPSWILHDIGVFSTLFILFAMPPTLQNWRLTGSYRIPPRWIRQKTSSTTKTPDQIFHRICSGSSS